MLKPNDDVWVDFDGREWPGEFIKNDGSFVMCHIFTDPEWDFGDGSSKVMPIQTVAVRNGSVRERVREDSPEILGPPEG